MPKIIALGCLLLAGFLTASALMAGASDAAPVPPTFQTSNRCLACHNGMTTPSGKDVSIGLAWRASIMANSARDPYWQASVRRESIDHPQSKDAVEDECSVCHMPMARYQAKVEGRRGQVFSHLPFHGASEAATLAEDGVSCSMCHQIEPQGLGTHSSFNGGFQIGTPESERDRPEYGPFPIEPGQQRIMDTSTGGFRPTDGAHIRDSAMCATCHTLYTTPLAKGGKQFGPFPEQVPYLEWLRSDYRGASSCQDCHMPAVHELAPVAAVFGPVRRGMRKHSFVGANFFMGNMLNRYRDELSVVALPQEMAAAAEETVAFLQSQAARVSIPTLEAGGDRVQFQVLVENLTGHKLPTAYPSRRAWLHVVVSDRNGRKVFESGALNTDGSIQANDNDADPLRYEPHYREITSPEQVQIYEPILQDGNGRVTTGLLSTVGYLKDNRLLPSGFQKEGAPSDVAVVGDAADDPNFTDKGDSVRYSVPLGGGEGPFHVEAELWYQPIGFRWAHNLAVYKQAEEPRRFVSYYDSMPQASAIVLARASASR